jgi:hypothetical protein
MLGRWAGIKCVNGSIVAITLPWRDLGGSLSDRVGQLIGLRRPNIHDNAIAGAILAALGFLPKLIHLNLSHNYVSSEIPAEVAASPLIHFLDLSYIRISVSILTHSPAASERPRPPPSSPLSEDFGEENTTKLRRLTAASDEAEGRRNRGIAGE